jgi:hypothetical protein
VIEYVALPGWEFGGIEQLAQNGRIFNVTGDRGALFMAFRTAHAELVGKLAQAGADGVGE